MSHEYRATVVWTGNQGTGTSGYRTYGRDHQILIDGKPVLKGSSDPAFRGDATRHNPEDLLVASLSACHMLWYLHLAVEARLVVTGYRDAATGEMAVDKDGGGRFVGVTLRPVVTLQSGDEAVAHALHDQAAKRCFIHNSVNFPVVHEPVIAREQR